jgi:hypothetical protein
MYKVPITLNRFQTVQVQHQKRRPSARVPSSSAPSPHGTPFGTWLLGKAYCGKYNQVNSLKSVSISVGRLFDFDITLGSGFWRKFENPRTPSFRVFENFQRTDGFHETQEHVELVHKVLTVGTNFWINLEVIQNHHFLPSLFFFSFVFKPYSSNYFRN